MNTVAHGLQPSFGITTSFNLIHVELAGNLTPGRPDCAHSLSGGPASSWHYSQVQQNPSGDHEYECDLFRSPWSSVNACTLRPLVHQVVSHIKTMILNHPALFLWCWPPEGIHHIQTHRSPRFPLQTSGFQPGVAAPMHKMTVLLLPEFPQCFYHLSCR